MWLPFQVYIFIYVTLNKQLSRNLEILRESFTEIKRVRYNNHIISMENFSFFRGGKYISIITNQSYVYEVYSLELWFRDMKREKNCL